MKVFKEIFRFSKFKISIKLGIKLIPPSLCYTVGWSPLKVIGRLPEFSELKKSLNFIKYFNHISSASIISKDRVFLNILYIIYRRTIIEYLYIS